MVVESAAEKKVYDLEIQSHLNMACRPSADGGDFLVILLFFSFLT
jgi:hypothetical protein